MTTMMDKKNEYAVIGVGLIAVLTFLYAVVLRQALLQWLSFMLTFVFLYLAVRLVRAVERIAAAVEE
ncbi:hypothetical protein ACFQJ8_10875 [Halocatena marina]